MTDPCNDSRINVHVALIALVGRNGSGARRMEMRKILMVGMAMQLVGCTSATMQGFSEIAAQDGV